MTCEDCRRAYRELKGIDPDCEACFPGVHENNIEAWDVYQLAAFDSMGISPEGVIAVGKEMGVSDLFEVLYKVAELSRHAKMVSEKMKSEGKEPAWQDSK